MSEHTRRKLTLPLSMSTVAMYLWWWWWWFDALIIWEIISLIAPESTDSRAPFVIGDLKVIVGIIIPFVLVIPLTVTV